MAVVTLEEARRHCRVSHSDDDGEIQLFIDAAHDYVRGRGVPKDALSITAVKAATLLMVGHFYENREATTTFPTRPLEMGVDALLQPYRIY